MGFLSTAILLGVWQIAALRVGADIILPSPLLVMAEFLKLVLSREFGPALAATFARGLEAFAFSCLAGIVLGFAAGSSRNFEAALAPILTTIRATPILALILLALLWFPAGFVPVFAAFLMAFPVMASAAAEGARAAPRELLEMSQLFKVPARRELFELRLPAAMPQLLAGARSAIGLCWKVVVTGEVLSQPVRAIGTGMQSSRVLLETPRVFAWAMAAILLCGLSEWLFGRLIAIGRKGEL
jgi:NitT/TauT family transport system permease protein